MRRRRGGGRRGRGRDDRAGLRRGRGPRASSSKPTARAPCPTPRPPAARRLSSAPSPDGLEAFRRPTAAGEAAPEQLDEIVICASSVETSIAGDPHPTPRLTPTRCHPTLTHHPTTPHPHPAPASPATAARVARCRTALVVARGGHAWLRRRDAPARPGGAAERQLVSPSASPPPSPSPAPAPSRPDARLVRRHRAARAQPMRASGASHCWQLSEVYPRVAGPRRARPPTAPARQLPGARTGSPTQRPRQPSTPLGAPPTTPPGAAPNACPAQRPARPDAAPDAGARALKPAEPEP